MVDVGISWADAEVVEYCRRDDKLEVTVRTWQEELCKIIFHEVLGVYDQGVGDISALYEIGDECDFMRDILAFHYELQPSTHPYRVYRFMTVSDECAAMEIVATRVTRS